MKHRTLPILLAAVSLWLPAGSALADGLVVKPRAYKGSLEERAQSAMIVFSGGDGEKSAVQDLILKIRVEGETDEFAWVVPLPNPPKTEKADPKLFEELFNYVEARKRPPVTPKNKLAFGGAKSDAKPAAEQTVEVVSREVVGSFDVAVVREKVAGALNDWLEKEGFQRVGGRKAEEVIGFYREKGYVFACMKVSDAALAEGGADLHPLRLTFETGGRDGIYFPMRLTGLQSSPFDVNLYVFYRAWLNDHINRYGYEHRGFKRNWRDYDSSRCKPNAGKTWSNPERDPYLVSHARRIPTLTKYFQARYPGERFYLTNIIARGLEPDAVADWSDDLWLYPYYTDPKFVPYDAR